MSERSAQVHCRPAVASAARQHYVIHAPIRQVLEAADARDIPTSSRLMRPEELLEAQGVWLASSGRGVVPVLRVDGHELATDEQLTEQMRYWCGFAEAPAKSG